MFLHRAAVFFQQRFQVPQDGLPGLSRGLQKLFGRAVVNIRDIVNNFPGQRLQLRPFLDADGSQTLHFPHGPRRNVIFQDKLHGVLVRFAENGRLQEVRLHIRVNTLDALVQSKWLILSKKARLSPSCNPTKYKRSICSASKR